MEASRERQSKGGTDGVRFSRQREQHVHKPGKWALELCDTKWLQNSLRRQEEVEKTEGNYFRSPPPQLYRNIIHIEHCVNLRMWWWWSYSLTCVWLFMILWTLAHQAPLSMRLAKEEYWSGLPFPSPGDLPDPGIKPASPTLAGGFFTTAPHGKSNFKVHNVMTWYIFILWNVYHMLSPTLACYLLH